jgi:DNA polymerase
MNPVFIDLETRSACDLKAEGGWRYSAHPTTRLLTVAWRVDGQDHVWLPGLTDLPDEYRELHLSGVNVHLRQDGIPTALTDVLDRDWVAHNAWGFDRQVWERLTGTRPRSWIDTQPLAMALGLPAGLQMIAMRLWGEGKYAEGSRELKNASKCLSVEDADPENVPFGRQVLVARYNVQDVRLLADLWAVIQERLVQPVTERQVMLASDACNSRGVLVDRPLLLALQTFMAEARERSVQRIAELTEGALPDRKALRSRVRVLAWLTQMGVSLGSSLRKEIIAQFIADNEEEAEERGSEADSQDATDNPNNPNLPLVVTVLSLRMQVIRVTEGKLESASRATDADSRARSLLVYHGAHTGRWAARRIQVHNLPRPKPGVDTWAVRNLFDQTGSLSCGDVEKTLPEDRSAYRVLSLDDVASAMIRSVFVPSPGKVLAAADLANIEARILAWLAGEKWLMESFWSSGDPYITMAERIFGPSDRWPKTAPTPKKHSYRQVGKIVELGAGFQLGAAKFTLYAAANGIDLGAVGTTPLACISAYRRAHPAIAGAEAGEYNGVPYFRGGIWDQYNAAVVSAVENNARVDVGPVSFFPQKDSLVCLLPSGRRIVYQQAKAEDRDFFGKMIRAVSYLSPRFGRVQLYGGKITENVVQAIARDVLGYGMVRCEQSGLPIVLHVHDELVAETEEERFEDFMSCVTDRPEWLTDFPLDAEGCTMPCYSKSPPPGKKDILYRNGAPL